MKKYWVLFLKNLRVLSCLAIRMRGVHPKHLVEIRAFWVKKHINKTDTILDLGCGNGERDFKIADKSAKIIAVDHDKRNIAYAIKEKNRLKLNNIKYICSDIFTYLRRVLDGKQIKFDRVMLLDVLEHIDERKELLDLAYRVLKNNGKLFLSVPNKGTSWKELQKEAGVNYFTDADHKTEYSKSQIVNELKRSKFRVLEMNPDVIDTPYAPLFDLIGGFSLRLYKKLLEWKRGEVMKHPNDASGWEIVCRKITT